MSITIENGKNDEANGSPQKLVKVKKRRESSASTEGLSPQVPNLPRSAYNPNSSPSVESISPSEARAKWDLEWEFVPEYRVNKDGESEVVIFIDPKDLLVAPCDSRNVGRALDEKFKQSVAEKGVGQSIQVCVVRSKKDPTYYRYAVLAGRGRRAAAILANNERTKLVCCLIKPVKNWIEALEIAYEENQLHQGLGTWDRIKNYEQLLELGCLKKDIAKIAGLSEAGLTKYLTVLTMPQKIQDYVRDGILDLSKVRELARLKDVRPDQDISEILVEFADKVVAEKWTSEEIHQEVNKLNAQNEKKVREQKGKSKTKGRHKKAQQEEPAETSRRVLTEFKYDRSRFTPITKKQGHLLAEYQDRKLKRYLERGAPIEKIKYQEGYLEGIKVCFALRDLPKYVSADSEA